ncbi:MAG TPA: hypothetical protein VFI74_06320 [Candidatus Saccharimonadales bacterium]|nr:hypothetical protein [Candidatus Saccharimonadales bacterium]
MTQTNHTPTFYDQYMRFMFSPVGLTVWIVGLLYAIGVFLEHLHPYTAFGLSAVLGLLIAIRTTESMQKRPTYFSKNILASRASVTRRFKKYLRQGQLPTDKKDYTEYAEFLKASEAYLTKNPPKQQKKTLILLMILSGLCIIMPGLTLFGLALLVIVLLLGRRLNTATQQQNQLNTVQKRLKTAHRK